MRSLLIGLFIALFAFVGLVAIGYEDTGVDANGVVFVRAKDCEVKGFELGTIGSASSKLRSSAEISFTTGCKILELVTTHKPSHLVSACSVQSKLISEPKIGQLFQRYFTYLVRLSGPKSTCTVNLLIEKIVKRLSLARSELDIFLGPNASKIQLAPSSTHKAAVRGNFPTEGFEGSARRVQLTFSERALAFWEHAFTIVFSAMMGVGFAIAMNSLARESQR